MTFVAHERQHRGWLVLVLEGDLDIYQASALRDRLTDAVTRAAAVQSDLPVQADGTDQTTGTRGLVLDLGAVEFMDSAGLGALVTGLRRAKADGAELRIAAATPLVATLFEVTGLTTVLSIYPTADEATTSGPTPPRR